MNHLDGLKITIERTSGGWLETPKNLSKEEVIEIGGDLCDCSFIGKYNVISSCWFGKGAKLLNIEGDEVDTLSLGELLVGALPIAEYLHRANQKRGTSGWIIDYFFSHEYDIQKNATLFEEFDNLVNNQLSIMESGGGVLGLRPIELDNLLIAKIVKYDITEFEGTLYKHLNVTCILINAIFDEAKKQWREFGKNSVSRFNDMLYGYNFMNKIHSLDQLNSNEIEKLYLGTELQSTLWVGNSAKHINLNNKSVNNEILLDVLNGKYPIENGIQENNEVVNRPLGWVLKLNPGKCFNTSYENSNTDTHLELLKIIVFKLEHEFTYKLKTNTKNKVKKVKNNSLLIAMFNTFNLCNSVWELGNKNIGSSLIIINASYDEADGKWYRLSHLDFEKNVNKLIMYYEDLVERYLCARDLFENTLAGQAGTSNTNAYPYAYDLGSRDKSIDYKLFEDEYEKLQTFFSDEYKKIKINGQ